MKREYKRKFQVHVTTVERKVTSVRIRKANLTLMQKGKPGQKHMKNVICTAFIKQKLMK